MPIWTIVLAPRIIRCPSLCKRSRIIEDLTRHREEQLPDHELAKRKDWRSLDLRSVIAAIS